MAWVTAEDLCNEYIWPSIGSLSKNSVTEYISIAMTLKGQKEKKKSLKNEI